MVRGSNPWSPVVPRRKARTVKIARKEGIHTKLSEILTSKHKVRVLTVERPINPFWNTRIGERWSDLIPPILILVDRIVHYPFNGKEIEELDFLPCLVLLELLALGYFKPRPKSPGLIIITKVFWRQWDRSRRITDYLGKNKRILWYEVLSNR
jgi:hypothetical protein